MINKFSEIEELFKEIDKFVDMNLSIYIIGGAALLKRGLKIATKDIDIIVATKQEFLKLQLILKLTGFIDKLPGKEYSNMNLSQIFQRGDFRIDLFEREVCGKFALTDEMKKRSEKVLELSNINLYLCST